MMVAANLAQHTNIGPQNGGKGVTNMDIGKGSTARIVAAFSVEDNDQIMLVTDAGKLIRCPLDDIGIKGRGSQGGVGFQS